MTTEQQDKAMLAEFMGWLVNKEWTELAPKKGWNHVNDLFSDYNSLMEVLTNISNIRDTLIEQTIFNKWLTITISLDGEVVRHSCYDYEDAIYRACVEFVKWWNEQQNKTK